MARLQQKGRVEEERDSARLTSLKWLAIAALLACGGCFGAGSLLRRRRRVHRLGRRNCHRGPGYSHAELRNSSLFGALAVVYNPVAPSIRHFFRRLGARAGNGDGDSVYRVAALASFRAVSKAAMAATLALRGSPAPAKGPPTFKKRNFQLGTNLAAVSVQVGQTSQQREADRDHGAFRNWSGRRSRSAQIPGPEVVRNLVFGFYEASCSKSQSITTVIRPRD